MFFRSSRVIRGEVVTYCRILQKASWVLGLLRPFSICSYLSALCRFEKDHHFSREKSKKKKKYSIWLSKAWKSPSIRFLFDNREIFYGQKVPSKCEPPRLVNLWQLIRRQYEVVSQFTVLVIWGFCPPCGWTLILKIIDQFWYPKKSKTVQK